MNKNNKTKAGNTLDKLSYKHYKEWVAFENEKDSPKKWVCGSFATVRGLMRIPHNNGYPEVTQELLVSLEKDIQDFKDSLK